MLLIWGFEDFIGKYILFPDIEGVYFSIKPSKDKIFKVVLAIWYPLVFMALKLRGFDKLDGAFNSKIP